MRRNQQPLRKCCQVDGLLDDVGVDEQRASDEAVVAGYDARLLVIGHKKIVGI